jgi:hypothetical protein
MHANPYPCRPRYAPPHPLLHVNKLLPAVYEQFEKCDLSVIRNKAAFLGGVMTRLRRQDGPRMHADVQVQKHS